MNSNETHLLKLKQVIGALLLALMFISCGKEAKNIPFLTPDRDIDPVNPGTSYNSSDLFQAVKRNDLDMLIDVIKAGVSIDSIENGESALTQAIKEDYNRIAVALVDMGINVNLNSSNGETPITMAFKKNFTTLSLKIMEKDQLFNNQNELFITAFGHRNLSLIKKLMELKKIDLSKLAVKENLYQVLVLSRVEDQIDDEELQFFSELFFKNGADLNKLTSLGQTLLALSLIYNQTDFAKFLLSKNIDINQTDLEGKTALHWNITQPNLANIQFLLDRNIDKKIKDKRKKTACDYARMIELKATRKEIKKMLKCFPYIF
jgi:ankyrin repeat protein